METRERHNNEKARVEKYLVLDVQKPTLNLSKQKFRKSSQWGLLKTDGRKSGKCQKIIKQH